MSDNLLSWRVENILFIVGIVILMLLAWNVVGAGVNMLRQQNNTGAVVNAGVGAAGAPALQA